MWKKQNYFTRTQTGFIVYIKTEDTYSDIAKDIITRFDTSNYELDRSLPKVKNKKIIRLLKDALGGYKQQ